MKLKNIVLLVMLILLIWAGYLWATTYKYAYTTEVTYLATDGYSGGQGDLAADGAYDYGADIDLETNGYYGIWVFVEHDSAGTTDDIIISYFGSYDGTNFDDVELTSMTCVSDGSDNQQSFGFFPAPPHGRFGVKTNGTTDSFDFKITFHPVRGDGT